MAPELEAVGPHIVAIHPLTKARTVQIADCSMSQYGNEYARQFAATGHMLTALETVLAGGHLNTGEQAIVANAIAKATGISIDEVIKYGI
jgi:hypothetical protein